MNKFIEAAQPHLPLMIYTVIAFAAVVLIVSVIKLFLRKRGERARALARQNNVLFSRLLTPDELDDRDPVITQQQAKGTILRGGRRPMLSDNGPAVDLSMFNTSLTNSASATSQPIKPLAQAAESETAPLFGNNASTVMRHQSINAAAVKAVPIIEEFELSDEQGYDVQTYDVQTISSNKLSGTDQTTNVQPPVAEPTDLEDRDTAVTEASYEKILVLSQRKYRLFERLLDRLETFHSGQGFMLLNNVQIGNLVRTDSSKAISLINHKSVDFVIVSEQCKAVAVIQCQDKPVQENVAIKAVCEKAGIAYFEVSDDYDAPVMNQISKILNLSEHLERTAA